MYGEMVLAEKQEVKIILQQRGKKIVVVAVKGDEERDIVIISKDVWGDKFSIEGAKDVEISSVLTLGKE